MIFGRLFFVLSAVELHMATLNMNICRRRAQLKNKKIICIWQRKRVYEKSRNSLGPTRWYSACVLKFLTLFNNNWTASSVWLNTFQEIRLTLLSSLEAFFTRCVWQMFFFVFIKFSTRINCKFSTHRQDN